MYNPSKEEVTKGFCHYGITLIEGKTLEKFNDILTALIQLFNCFPAYITLTGAYTETESECYYAKIKIKKEILIEKLSNIKILTEKAISNKGYVIHFGI